MQKATAFKPAASFSEEAEGYVVLPHDGRHLRRKLLHLENGDMVMLDLKEPVLFAHGDRLVLDDGTSVEIRAADERLFEVRGRDAQHLTELAWHLGNRHLAAQICDDRILILRDHVIKEMLVGLGASVMDVVEPFHPVRGAYHAHGGGHGHANHGPASHGPE